MDRMPPERFPLIMFVDVAPSRRAETTVLFYRGEEVSRRDFLLQDLADVLRFIEIEICERRPDVLLVEVAGVGHMVIDELRRRGIEVTPIRTGRR